MPDHLPRPPFLLRKWASALNMVPRPQYRIGVLIFFHPKSLVEVAVRILHMLDRPIGNSLSSVRVFATRSLRIGQVRPRLSPAVRD